MECCIMDDSLLRIIQISDTHLFEDPDKILLGVKTQESFEAVVDLLKSEAGNIDLILHSGDMSQDGSEASYIRIANSFKQFNVPVYCVPGNHDNPKIMAGIYPRGIISNDRHILLKNWHIILLNSQKPGKVEGHLEQSQLNYMQQCLQAYPEHNAIIVFHHQPVPVGSRWLDNHVVTNAAEFWKVISMYPKVNIILFGHVHQENELTWNGIRCFSTPSTCIQFKCKQDNFELEKLPPGYRWIHLHEDGRFETGVRRVAEYIGFFDINAKGY